MPHFSRVCKFVESGVVVKWNTGKGIMTNLEQMLINFFKQKDLSHVELNVISKNLLAKRSWESLGYITFREQMRKKI